MKKIVLLVIFVIALGALYVTFKGTPGTHENKVAVGLFAPSFEVVDNASGRKISSEELKGKVVFVNFWATWCPPCREEIPSVEALYKAAGGNSNFKMITILYKDSYEGGTSFLKQNGLTFPVYMDSADISARNFGVTGVPETYIIDKKGTLRKRVSGPADWNSAEARDLINSLLNE